MSALSAAAAVVALLLFHCVSVLLHYSYFPACACCFLVCWISFGDVLIGQLSDFVVDNPRALAMCAEAFGVLFAADIWAAKGAELIRKGLRVPLPDEEGLAVKVSLEQ